MKTAPDFTLKNQRGEDVSLQSFSGKWVVLYFYPKDDTPGCTAEACSLRDAKQELINLGAEVIGISKDSTESHQKFAEKYGLHFTLLSDPTHETIAVYGAWSGDGTLRKTFIIDPDGNIRKEYDQVTPEGHGEQVVDELKSLRKS